MDSVIRELLKTRVAVYTVSGNTSYTDEGVLEAYDGAWLKLRKDSGEALYFSLHNVRLLKSKEMRENFVR